MKRFNAWHILNNLVMTFNASGRWVWIRFNSLTSRLSDYCFDHMKKAIPDEYHHLLDEIEKANSEQEVRDELERLRRVVQRVYMSAIPDLQFPGRSFIASEMIDELCKVLTESEPV